MNLSHHETIIKKETPDSEIKFTSSPLASADGSHYKGTESPALNAYIFKQRPQIRHDPTFSPFVSPFSENKPQRCSPSEVRPSNIISSFFSPLESGLRRESIDDRGTQVNGRPKIQPSQICDPLPDQPFPLSNAVSTPIRAINQKDIEELRREITLAREESKKPAEEVQPKKRHNKARVRRTVRATSPAPVVGRKKEKPFACKYCKMSFSKAQALGGHMSRRHPGKSREYNYKKTIRKGREIERIKLRLAKKKYFSTLNYDYDDLLKTVEGKMRARSLMNRAKIKRIKKGLTENEVNNYIDSRFMMDA